MVVEENLKGEDYFIGDVPGGAEQLKLVLAKLTENDRLFLVGDLADRGADSFGVYQLIMEINQARQKEGLPIQIYVTHGNHEDMLLDFYKVRDNPSKTLLRKLKLRK